MKTTSHLSTYKCFECGAVFDAPEYSENDFDDGREIFSRCPECGSFGIEEAQMCKVCGEPCLDKELIEGVCVDCLRKAMNDYEVLRHFFALDDNLSNLAEYLARRAKNATN